MEIGSRDLQPVRVRRIRDNNRILAFFMNVSTCFLVLVVINFLIIEGIYCKRQGIFENDFRFYVKLQSIFKNPFRFKVKR